MRFCKIDVWTNIFLLLFIYISIKIGYCIYFMIRHVSKALLRQFGTRYNSRQVQLIHKSQERANYSPFIIYRAMARMSIDAKINKEELFEKPNDQSYSKQVDIKCQKTPENSGCHYKTQMSKGFNWAEELRKLFSAGIKTLVTLITAWFVQLQQQNTGFIATKINRMRQNQQKLIKVQKGDLVIADMQKNPNHKSDDGKLLEKFQCLDNKQQKTDIQAIIKHDDSKVIQYVQAFTGNGLSTNLVRSINRKIKQQKQKSQAIVNVEKEGKQRQNSQSIQKLDQGDPAKSKKQKKFNISKLYYYDFKEPPGIQMKDDAQWGQASSLHNLLTNLIHNAKNIKENKQKENKQQENKQQENKQKENKNDKKMPYLIIDNVHLLAYSFQILKRQRLEELFKQIMYLSKQKIAKVILISGNHYFYDSYIKKLESIDLQDFKKEIYPQLDKELDLKPILQKRMAYDKIIKIKPEIKKQLDAVIEFISSNNDCVKEQMRILKKMQLDAKSSYQKYLKIKKLEDSDAVFDDFMKNNFVKSLTNFDKKIEEAKKVCDQIIDKKRDHIQKAIGISVYKNLDEKAIERLKSIQKYKIELLNDILNKRYDKNVKAKSAFYLDYNDAKLQAFRELNNDEILHGFEFVSKSTQLAFKKAIEANPKFLSMHWFYILLRRFD